MATYGYLLLVSCLCGIFFTGGESISRQEIDLLNVVTKYQNNPSFEKEWKKHVNLFKSQNTKNDEIPPFTCQVPPIGEKPTSVHQLRPGDINAVAAFGDSVTAGNGADADNLLEVIINARGKSWCIGGEESIETVLTVPNVLKKFNPNLKGYSTEASDEDDPEAGMNVARMGARATHLPAQADKMLERFRSHESIDFNDDWKLITLFIGGNDLCGYCRDRPNRAPEVFAGHIKNTLDKLHAQLPRAIVNVVSMFDVSPVRHLSSGFICDLLQERFCSCALYEETRPELRPVQLLYHEKVKEIIDSGRYDTRDDFTVVLQPHMRDLIPPKLPNGDYDRSFFSPDCFHPGRKGHAGLALTLWNMMLTKVQEKPNSINPGDPLAFKCPTEQDPYIFTNKNSDPIKFNQRKIKIETDKIQQQFSREIVNNDGAGNDYSKVNGLVVGLGTAIGILGCSLLAILAIMVYKRKRSISSVEDKVVVVKDNPTFEMSA